MTSSTAPSLAAFNQRGGRGRSCARSRGTTRPQTQRRFCRTCYEAEKGRSTYLSHNAEKYNCPSKIKLNTLADDVLPPEVREFEQETEESETDATQVESTQLSVINTTNTGLNTLKPVPKQLLTVADAAGEPVHIELDSAATVNYISQDEALTRNFTIMPNSQMSKLGDGTTTLQPIGEISTYFYRDDLPLRYDPLAV